MGPDLIKNTIGLLVPLGGMVLTFGIVYLVLEYRNRRARQLHETVGRFAERGMHVPPELLTAQNRPHSRLHGALTLMGLGIGLIIYLLLEPDSNWGIGAIPLAVGLAQLLAIRLESSIRPVDAR